MKQIYLMFFFNLITVSALAEDFIVEYNDPKAPVSFKYDKREYAVILNTRNLQSGGIVSVPSRNYGKKESTCQDRKYNKHFCPRISFSIGEHTLFGIYDDKPQKVENIENLDWHFPEDSQGIPGTLKEIKKTFFPEYQGKDWSQVSIDILCRQLPLNNGKSFYYRGHYQFTKVFYIDSLKSSFRGKISEDIYSTMEQTGADDTDPEVVASYIQTSKFFEENYCLNNEALKSWDVGNHARMLIDSVKPNLSFFKKFVDENKAREALKIVPVKKSN